MKLKTATGTGRVFEPEGKATVIRLIQALGYKGYQDFKIRLSQSLEPEGVAEALSRDLSPDDPIEVVASRIAQLALIDTLLVGVYLRRVPESSERLVKARKALVDKRVP